MVTFTVSIADSTISTATTKTKDIVNSLPIQKVTKATSTSITPWTEKIESVSPRMKVEGNERKLAMYF